MASNHTYLTGNKEAIERFVDKFDVGQTICLSRFRQEPPLILLLAKILIRYSSSTAMVCSDLASAIYFASLRHLTRDCNGIQTDDTRRIGVLWSGDHLFEGTVETLEKLRRAGMIPSSSYYHGSQEETAS